MIEITDHDSWLVMLDWLEDCGFDVQPYRVVRQATVRVSNHFGRSNYNGDGYGDGDGDCQGNGCGYGDGNGLGDGYGNGDGNGDGRGYRENSILNLWE